MTPQDLGLMKVCYSVNETLKLLSISRWTLYDRVKRGELKPVKLGKKALFYATDLAAFLVKLRERSVNAPWQPKLGV
jgi:excisionase family DNA binding protein